MQITEEPVLKGGRFEYTLTGYNEGGKVREVTFTSEKILRENAILKVKVQRNIFRRMGRSSS